MRGGLSVLSLAWMLVFAGCAAESDADEDTEPELLRAEITGDVDRTVICEPGSVWTSTSKRIELRSFSFWQGSSGYRIDRNTLTAAQRTALAGLCVRSQPTGPVLADVSAVQIVVTDNNGSTKSYRAALDDVLDGDETDHALPTIQYDSLKPFLSTFKCLHAVESRAAAPRKGESAEGFGPPWQYAPSLGSDPSCLNGVSATSGCQDSWMKLTVSARKRMTFNTENCFGVTQIKLFALDGTMQLAASPTGSRPSCPSLSYSFAPGTYLLNLRKTNAGGACTSGGGAGDYWLRVTSQ